MHSCPLREIDRIPDQRGRWLDNCNSELSVFEWDSMFVEAAWSKCKDPWEVVHEIV
jgi:hypothetical protein